MPIEQGADVATVRRFNRAYTNRLGLLNGHLDGSPFTLSEARILYELAHREGPTGAELARALHLDPAQISRTFKRFFRRGLLKPRENPSDRRHQVQVLTDAGRAAFAALDQGTMQATGRLLDGLTPDQRGRLIGAVAAITQIFDNEAPSPPVLRDLRAGDLGMVTARQAILYAQEYGWDAGYEVLVARILADFRNTFDPSREAGWIADVDGQMVGSIFLMASDEPNVGKLRLLYVEPEMRGTGLGTLLVNTCLQRARAVGYERLDLWTNDVLTNARRLYERAGFELVSEGRHRSFGQDLVGQTWSKDL